MNQRSTSIAMPRDHRIIRAVLGCLLAVLAIAMTSQSALAHGETTPREAEIIAYLQGAGYIVDSEDDFIAVTTEEENASVLVIKLDGVDRDVTYIAFHTAEPGSAVINRFNLEVKFARAYIDEDNDVVLQMDRNASGGISLANIGSDVGLFLLLDQKLRSMLESEGN